MSITLTPADWLALFGHFLSLSLLAVGGAMATAPDMHRYLVGTRGWLSDECMVRVVRKIAYYARPYNVVVFMDEGRQPLGYYCDVVTPVVRRAADYHMTDLIADAWIRPDGRYEALDLDELDDAVCVGLILPDQANEIRQHLNRLLDDVDAGRFPSDYLD